MTTRSCRLLFALAALPVCLPATADAIPTLQLYIEGATYNSTTQSWEVSNPPANGAPLRLWTIGNVAGPGGVGTIRNVRLAVAYEAQSYAPDITVSPTTTGGFGGFTDPSEPAGTGHYIQTVTNGSRPLLSNGQALASHGIYGAGVHWQEFALGDFTLHDSPIGDFINSFPTVLTPNAAQINAYEIKVFSDTAAGGFLDLHFDLYDSVAATNHARFAPFSHDADGNGNVVPEPASLALLSAGAAAAFLAARKRRFARR